MLCLGIESSCDDTSLALVEDGIVKGEKSFSQTNLHALFGGVVPELASREHSRCIAALFDSLLEETGVTSKDLQAVAVARGPGLLGSLLVGVSFAKALCAGLQIPLIGVNHLHAHLFACGIENTLSFPAIGLLVSGGHTHLYRIESEESFTLLGRTLDDAAGEAFDKAGKMLGMPYPAGRLIDELTTKGKGDSALFPRPYLDNDNLDFSFSGLKTSMALRMKALGINPVRFCAEDGSLIFSCDEQRQCIANICSSYTIAVVETLKEKTQRAFLQNPDTKMLLVAGGVAANTHLKRSLTELSMVHKKKCIAPSPPFCTDNGAMVAFLGEKLAKKGKHHNLSMEAIPRGKKIPDDFLFTNVTTCVG